MLSSSPRRPALQPAPDRVAAVGIDREQEVSAIKIHSRQAPFRRVIDPGRNASFGRPDQCPSTRLEDRAESTSTTWVLRPRSCVSALVSDVRRGSGGEADPGRAPCGQRCVVGVMACMAGRVRTQTAELNRRSQGMRCSCIHGQRARRRMKRQSGAVAAKEPMAWLRVARPPLAGGAAHRTSPPRGGPLNGRSPARSRAAECGATTLPAMQQNAHHASRRARCTGCARRLASHRPWLRQAAHASVGAGLETSCPEQTGRRSTTGWPPGAPVRSAWAARGASGGRVGAPSARAFRRPCCNHVQSCTSVCSSPI